MHERRWILASVLFIAAVAALVALPSRGGAPDEAQMQAWAKAMTPGAPHAELAEQAGEWRMAGTMWGEKGAPPVTFKGLATKTMVLGGRFLQEEVTGDFMDHVFHGLGLTGYDNVTKQYVGVWLDNMATGLPYFTGQADGPGARTFKSMANDPMTGKAIRTRSVGKQVDHDHLTYESYITLPDGTEQLHMRLEYTRVN
jgi:hypothetical protein